MLTTNTLQAILSLAEKAEKEMEKFGFSFTHKRLICPGLSSYEEKFPQRFKTSPAFRDLR